MQDEVSKLRREVFRNQSRRDSRSPAQADDGDNQSSRQDEQLRQGEEMQHLQQEVARLRQERDAARMQAGAITAKQALNKTPVGECFAPLRHTASLCASIQPL